MNFQQNIVCPDYNHSNLGIISSVLNYYAVPSSTKSSTDVDSLLAQKRPRNVIFLLIDAMGTGILNRHLPEDGFLRSHRRRDLTAVYPCTTVCVTSSFFSGLQPVSHAWLAWSLYFKEWDECIEVFPYRDAFTGEPIDPNEKNILDFMGFRTIFEQIEHNADRKIKIDCIFTDVARQRLVQIAGDRLTKAHTLEELFQNIELKCAEEGDHFIIGYWKSPDDLLHNNRLSHESVTEFLSKTDSLLEQYSPRFSDAVGIISADHGMQDIFNHFHLDQISPLSELMNHYPSGDPRAKAISVIPGKEDLFASRFERELGDEFILLSADEFLRRGFLGEGPLHPKVKDFLGSFIALGVGHSDLLYAPPGAKPPKEFKGHHAGLTEDEMQVPLILF